MHLINTKSLQLHQVVSEEDKSYAILSHRWQESEVLFQDMANLDACDKAGVPKLKALCSLLNSLDIEYAWMDTCCIDKKSSAELSEAINSMFTYYRSATTCIVYLSDVDVSRDSPEFERQFRNSVWFTRCWTLQVLIAPRRLEFFNFHWEFLSNRDNLQSLIRDVTSVSIFVLVGGSLAKCSIAERMSWASNRSATRREDIAYSLMGLFNINMPMLYDEGDRSFERLQEEIIRYSDDETIFAWSFDPLIPKSYTGGLLAPSPLCFRNCGNLRPMHLHERDAGFTLTNRGISADLKLQYMKIDSMKHPPVPIDRAMLNFSFLSDTYKFVGLYLERIDSRTNEYIRSHRFGGRWMGTVGDVDLILEKPRKV